MSIIRQLAVAVALCAAHATGYSARPSAFVRPHAIAVARQPPAAAPQTARAALIARADAEISWRSPSRAACLVTMPLRAIRRGATRAFSSVLTAFLAFFFFGTPAFAASSAGTAAVAMPPAAGVLAAGAGVSAAVYAASRLISGRRGGAPTEEELHAPPAPADDAPPTLSEDALLMASLRDRMLNLHADKEEELDAAAGLDEDELEMDQEMLDVRAERADYPISSADRSPTAVLEPPADDEPLAPPARAGEDAVSDAAPEEPPLARAEDIALLEKLFNSGDAEQ